MFYYYLDSNNELDTALGLLQNNSHSLPTKIKRFYFLYLYYI